MKPTKIHLPTLITTFALVGLIADIVPVPGLGDGVLIQSMQKIGNIFQPPSQAASSTAHP